MARGKEEFDHGNYGIFAGSEGLANLNTMDVEQTPEGYEMTRPCEGCGELRKCAISWAELYCLQYGIDPAKVGEAIRRPDIFDTQWVYSPKHMCFHPGFKCGCMGNPLVLFNMTPVMAERALREAGRNGILSEGQQAIIRHISPVVRQLADVRNGVPARQVQQQYRQQRPPPNGVPSQGGGRGFFGR